MTCSWILVLNKTKNHPILEGLMSLQVRQSIALKWDELFITMRKNQKVLGSSIRERK